MIRNFNFTKDIVHNSIKKHIKCLGIKLPKICKTYFNKTLLKNTKTHLNTWNYILIL